MASQQSLAALREKMGLSKPLWQQFFYYIRDVIHGDFGTSWQTTRPVTEDLFQRFPATLQMVTFALLLGPIHRLSPRCSGGASARADPQICRLLRFACGSHAGLLAGAGGLDHLHTQLGWIAAPLGRIDMAVVPPKTVTGSLVIDNPSPAISKRFLHRRSFGLPVRAGITQRVGFEDDANEDEPCPVD